jgi:hypothetical protein
MSDELREILADGEPVSKARLREYLGRHAGPTILAEGFGVRGQTRSLPVPDEAVQTANYEGLIAALRAATARGGGVVLLPPGHIFINRTIDIDSETLGSPYDGGDSRKHIQINILGAGRRTTKLVQNHLTEPLIRTFNFEPTTEKSGFELRLQALTLLGRGPNSTGNLLALYSWSHHVIEDVWLEGTGGCAIHIAMSERVVLRDVVVYRCRQALMMHDAVNETYLFNFLPLSCGVVGDPLLPVPQDRYWGPNWDGFGNFPNEGPVVQSRRACMHIEGNQNFRWIGGSCKVLSVLAGVKLRNCENAQIDNVYFEGFPRSGPTTNPSVIFGGAMERTWLSEPISAGAQRIKVEDSSWFPRRHTREKELTGYDPHYANAFAIYNPARPTEYEIVEVQGFVHEVMHVLRRGAPGGRLRLRDRPARAWPAGSVVTELAFGLGNLTLHGNHLAGLSSFDSLPKLELVENWERGDTNGQVIAGFVADDFCSAPNFPAGDFPGSCHLELTGHNRVRRNRNRKEATHRVQVHHRAIVYLSQESQFGGLVVEQASAAHPRWMTVSKALSDHKPLIVSESGGAMNLRHEESFSADEGRDGLVGSWRRLFTAPYGAVVDCRLYSLRPDFHQEQGHDFVASFVVDTAGSWPPELSMRYIRGRNDLTPYIRLTHIGGGRSVAVELGLARSDSIDRRPVVLRFDATAICGEVEEDDTQTTPRNAWVFPLAPAQALDITPVRPVSRAAAVAAAEGGGELFVEDGALKYRSPTGVVTVLAPR